MTTSPDESLGGSQRAPDTGRVDTSKQETFATRSPQTVILIVAALVVAWLALVPVVYLLWGTFIDDEGFSLNAFERAFGGNRIGPMVYDTAVFTIGSTLITVCLGAILAFLTERTDLRLKKLVYACALIPIIIPGVLYTIAWIFLAAPRTGILNTLLQSWLGVDITLNVFSMPGMIIVQSLDTVPLVFLLMVASFRSFDSSLEESALTSGASLLTVIWRISIPLARPAIFASCLIIFVRSIEAFETPVLLGLPAGIWVLTSRIWDAMDDIPPDIGQAGAFSATLILVTAIALTLYSRLSKNSKRFATVTGKGYRPKALPLGRLRRPITILIGAYFAVTILMPLAVLAHFSFQPFLRPPTWGAITSATVDNYVRIFEHDQTVGAFTNSIVLATGSATFVMLLAALASWITVRTRIRGRWALDSLTFLPFILPGLVIGVALLFVYLRAPVPVYGTLLILFIAYCTKGLPFGMRFASASMHQISAELEESGRVSGASWWQGFSRITVPLLMPGLIGGWIYIFLIMMRELTSSLLLYSPGNEVLAVVIWEQYNLGNFTELAALGMIMIASFSAIVYIAQRAGARMGGAMERL